MVPMVEVTANADATEIDVDGVFDETTGIRYIGKATKTFDGSWLCLANIGGALCRVELRVAPTIHVGSDPGDEDDRPAKESQLARDLGHGYRRPR
jgi:hypothetical protein